MHLPPGIEWGQEDIANKSTNMSDMTFTGATIASPIIMFLSGLAGNLLALLVLHQTRMESQRLMFHSLVAGLVWNDLVGIVLTSPVTIASYFNGLKMPGGEHLCRFNGFIMVCFGLSTPMIVSALAIERLLFVKFTFFYAKHCAPGAARLLMVAIWGFVLFFGLLPLFGFGEYVEQYPKTWCFLNFRALSPVHAAYGYLYSSLNLMLVVVMVICNLWVVITLARVRGYKRKYSNGNVMTGEGVTDDKQQQQAVKRRTQKDIELQMIVVMCAITTIFAACWAPLMIYISVTLAIKGQTTGVLGLVAIRLASLNQTLNPWLYVILRRALIIRIKRYCCLWRQFFRARSTLSQGPVGHRHQYVHVRHQINQRANVVGGQVKFDSLSHSMRRCMKPAIPGAISLPDVMIVNTGRRDTSIPLPDVTKAETFAGRISRSYSLGSVVSCDSPAALQSGAYLRDAFVSSQINDNSHVNALSGGYSKDTDNSKMNDKHPETQVRDGKCRYQRTNDQAAVAKLPEVYDIQKYHPKLVSTKCNTFAISVINSDDSARTHQSSCSYDELLSSDRTGPVDDNSGKEFMSGTSAYSDRGSYGQLSESLHPNRSSSRSFSCGTTRSDSPSPSTKISSGDIQIINTAPSTRRNVQNSSMRTSEQQALTDSTNVNPSDNSSCLDGREDSSDELLDNADTQCVLTHKSTLALDDALLSNIRTDDSLCLSDASKTSSTENTSKVKPESVTENLQNHQDISVPDTTLREHVTDEEFLYAGHIRHGLTDTILETSSDPICFPPSSSQYNLIQKSPDLNITEMSPDKEHAEPAFFSGGDRCLLVEGHDSDVRTLSREITGESLA